MKTHINAWLFASVVTAIIGGILLFTGLQRQAGLVLLIMCIWMTSIALVFAVLDEDPSRGLVKHHPMKTPLTGLVIGGLIASLGMYTTISHPSMIASTFTAIGMTAWVVFMIITISVDGNRRTR